MKFLILDSLKGIIKRSPIEVLSQQTITSSSGSATIDWNAGNNAIITLTENTTLTFTDPTSACHLQLIIDQDATGGWTLTLPTGIYWVGKTAPTFTTTASGRDILTLYFDGSNYNAMIANNWGVV